MNGSASALRQLHRIHRQLADLRDRLARGPRKIRTAEANVERLESQVDKDKQTLTKARVAADQKQLQLKERESRLQDLKAKLNACKSNREYQALQEQIAADQQANSVLSDEILELLEQIDDHQARVAASQKSLAKAQQELEQHRQRVMDDREGLEREVARVAAELHEAEAVLPAELRKEYERIARARGADAMAPVEGECCGHCFQLVTPQTLNELHLGRPVFCKSCGCLLYVPEDE